MSKCTLYSSLRMSLFSICFSKCCLLFLILMCQKKLECAQCGDVSDQLVDISFHYFLLIVIPLSLSAEHLFDESLISSLHRLFWIFIPFLGHVLLLSYVPHLVIRPASCHMFHFSLRFLVSSCSCALTTWRTRHRHVSFASGFGAVSTARGYFLFVCGHRGLVLCPRSYFLIRQILM